MKRCTLFGDTLYGKAVLFKLGHVKQIWYLLPMRAAKIQASLRIRAAQSRQNLRCSLIQTVSQGEPSDRKPDPWPFWMAGHAQLKFVMTECSKTQISLTGTARIAQLIECPLRGTGGHGLDPGPQHTKVVKNGTSCSSLGTQTYWVELGLVDPVSG